MEVGREGLWELDQRVVGVCTVGQITEDLVERAVLLDDVNDVLDVLTQEAHHALLVLVGVAVIEVVLGDLAREVIQLPLLGHRRADQRRALELELILVGGARERGGERVAAR